MKINSLPLMKTYKLENDPDGVATIVVRQATEGETIERNEMFTKQSRSYEDTDSGEIVRFEQHYNIRKVRRKEAYLTLASVTGITNEKNKELFKSVNGPDGPRIKSGMTEEQFNAAFDMLPTSVANEIYQKVLLVNPDWGVSTSNEDDEEEEEEAVLAIEGE